MVYTLQAHDGVVEVGAASAKAVMALQALVADAPAPSGILVARYLALLSDMTSDASVRLALVRDIDGPDRRRHVFLTLT